MSDNDYLYQYIVNYKRRFDGNSPTRREICEDCGISSTSVATYKLHQLEAAGLIKLAAGRAGHISVVGGEWIPPQ